MSEAIERPPIYELSYQCRLVSALNRMNADCPSRKYPYISEEYREAATMVWTYLRDAYPEGHEIHQEADKLIRLLQEVQ